MNRIRAVLFDLGDTLWYTPQPPQERALLRRRAALLRGWLTERGLDVSCPVPALARAIQQAEWSAATRAYAGDLRSPDFAALVRSVVARHGLRLDAAAAAALWQALDPGGVFLGRVPCGDATSTLRWLRRRGLRLGVVTNRSHGGATLHAELERMGWGGLFAGVVASCDAGWMKPWPALFDAALRELGIGSGEAVMVGDSLRADIAGAAAAGIRTVWKRPRQWYPEEARLPGGRTVRPDHVITELAALKDLGIFDENLSVRHHREEPDGSPCAWLPPDHSEVQP